ncbi:MAG: hypothetical protein R3A13_04645 [Bdellovibrionota bacterium]
MPKKNEYGKFIIPAGEVGTFAVCPESWRLSAIENNKVKQVKTAEAGQRMHKTWAKTFEEAADLTKHLRVLLYLVAAAILGYIFLF